MKRDWLLWAVLTLFIVLVARFVYDGVERRLLEMEELELALSGSRIPVYGLNDAADAMTGRDRDPDYGRLKIMEAILDEMLERESMARVYESREHVRKYRWNKPFLEEFDRQIAWMEGLLAGTPDEMFRAYRKWHDSRRPAWSKKAAYEYERLDYAWLQLAIDRGSKEAKMYWAIQPIDDPDPDDPKQLEYGRASLELLAYRNYGPALHEVIRRKRDGIGFPVNYVEAYYWALRARRAGLDMTEEIEDLTRLTTPAERAFAEDRLARGLGPGPLDRRYAD